MKKILFLFALLLAPFVALAAGLEVSPAKVDAQVAVGGSATVVLKVANPTVDVQLFEVYTDDLTENFKITPASFTLEAGARKEVSVSFVSGERESSRLQTNISVVSKPLADSRFKAGAGTKIPMSITISPAVAAVGDTTGADSSSAKPDYFSYGLMALALVSVTIMYAPWKKRLSKIG